MDETAFRQAFTSTISRPCPFEKSVLTRCAACSQAARHYIAEREVVACVSGPAHRRCVELRVLLRENFLFALHRSHIDGPLPHAQEMRMQCGGLRGLRFALDGGAHPDVGDGVDDVAGLLARALQRYGGLADLPFALMVRRAMSERRRR